MAFRLSQNFHKPQQHGSKVFKVYFTAVIIVSVYMLCVRGIPQWTRDPTKKTSWFWLESFVNINFMLEYFYRYVHYSYTAWLTFKNILLDSLLAQISSNF